MGKPLNHLLLAPDVLLGLDDALLGLGKVPMLLLLISHPGDSRSTRRPASAPSIPMRPARTRCAAAVTSSTMSGPKPPTRAGQSIS